MITGNFTPDDMLASLYPMAGVFARATGAVLLFPAFTVVSVPMRVKLALNLCFAIVLFTALPDEARSLPQRSPEAALLRELLTGVLIGISIRILVGALQIAGVIAAQSTSLSQMFGGAAEAGPMPVMGHVIAFSALAFAFAMGLHLQIVRYYVDSYEWVPMGTLPDLGAAVEMGIEGVGASFYLGVALAAPFMIGSTLYNITLGAINRAMPQLMVAFVGAPALIACGMILLLFLAPLIAGIWYQHATALLTGGTHSLP